IPADGHKTTLFMPANAGREMGMGVKIVTLGEGSGSRSGTVTPSSTSTGGRTSGSSTTPKGSLTLLDNDGTPTAILNAEELTAFRTALATTMLLRKRARVHTLTVFGAGKQAYWH